MQSPQKPTPDLIRHYIQAFDAGEPGRVDNAIAELFRTFPDNSRFEFVLLKVTTVNSLSHTQIWDVVTVAQRICDLEIDLRLKSRDPELVTEITPTKDKTGKTRHNYSFATKYCSWHALDAYPIYDKYVSRLIWAYQGADRFARFSRSDLKDYATFKEIVDRFRQSYGLTEFSYKALDKFLWGYGKKCFPNT